MKSNWESKNLSQICTIARGGSPRPINSFLTDAEDGISWIKIGDVPEGSKYIVSTKQKIKKEGVSRSRKVSPGDFLLSNSMSFGRPYILKIEGCIHDGWLVLTLNEDVVDPNYLYYFLSSQIAYTQLDRMAQGSTVRNINIEIAKKLEVYLPDSLKEQRQIVEILDEKFETTDKLKSVAEEQLASTKELFESRLNEVFITVSKKNKLIEMSEIYDVRDGTHDSPKYQAEGYPLVTSKNLKNGELSLGKIKYISEKDYLDISKRSAVSKGDVLFAMIGTIGNPVVIYDIPNFAIKNVALFKVSENQNSNFLRYYLMTKFVIDKMKKEAKGTTQQFVGLGYLRSFPIPIVSLEEQENFVKEFDELSEKTNELEVIFRSKIAELEELKKSYLHEAFSGKL